MLLGLVDQIWIRAHLVELLDVAAAAVEEVAVVDSDVTVEGVALEVEIVDAAMMQQIDAAVKEVRMALPSVAVVVVSAVEV
jgi:hypothetical protein